MADTLAWPVHVEAGRIATVPYRSDDLELQNVLVLMATTPGERIAGDLTYGTPDQVGAREYDEQAVISAAEQWCRRAEIVDLEAVMASDDVRRIDVRAAVRRR